MIQLGLAVTQRTTLGAYWAKMERMLQQVPVVTTAMAMKMMMMVTKTDTGDDDDDCSVFEVASRISPVQENTSDDYYGPYWDNSPTCTPYLGHVSD